VNYDAWRRLLRKKEKTGPSLLPRKPRRASEFLHLQKKTIFSFRFGAIEKLKIFSKEGSTLSCQPLRWRRSAVGFPNFATGQNIIIQMAVQWAMNRQSAESSGENQGQPQDPRATVYGHQALGHPPFLCGHASRGSRF